MDRKPKTRFNLICVTAATALVVASAVSFPIRSIATGKQSPDHKCPAVFAQFGFNLEASNKHIRRGRFQEAMWILREQGMEQQADALEAGLKASIVNGRMVHRTYTMHGSNNEGRIFLNTNVSGLFRIGPGYRHEIAAYKLDRLLDLNVVPLTVEKQVGEHMGSFQLWIPNSSTAWKEENLNRNISPRNRNFLNFLIHSTDASNPGNILYTSSNRIAAIDNQLSFARTDETMPKLSDEAARELVPSYRVYLKLKQLDDATLRREVLPYMGFGEKAFEQLLIRRDFLIKTIEDQITRFGEQNVFDL